MRSPYQGLESRSYWRTGVAERDGLAHGDVYRKKFTIGAKDRIAVAGSCFAQPIGQRLRTSGFDVLDVEPPPPGLTGEAAQRFGYALYSARHGNIHTVRQLLQLSQECFGQRRVAEPVWEKQGRYYDALRPAVEPQGLPSPAAVQAHRRQHLARFNLLLYNTTVLIFTLGSTETWRHRADGTVYPTAPGTIAGSFDPDQHEYVNLTYNDVVDDFLALRGLLHKIRPSIRFLLTVSPVPLTATAGTEHVLPATTYSKSVLRAAAGYLAQTYEDVDYFPSYEIITAPFSRGIFYEDNLRSITASGLDLITRIFFCEHQPIKPGTEASTVVRQNGLPTESLTEMPREERVCCEDELLDAFAQ
jgi:hypothetical protein